MTPIPFDRRLARLNSLIGGLNDDEFDLIAPQLQLVELRFKDELTSPGLPVSDIFFPCTSVVTMLMHESSGGSVGLALIGKDGLVGLEAVSDRPTAMHTALCQAPGLCLRMKRNDFLWAIRHIALLHDGAMAYFQSQLREFAQVVACHQGHDIEQRLSKWILMIVDQSGPEFFLTQELLAELLGTHRPGVSLAASALQQAGLISYRRGKITVLDRDGLESHSCDCYGKLRRRS